MARLGIYEVRLIAGLALRNGEASERDLRQLFERPSHLVGAVASLAGVAVVVHDPVQARVRLLRGRACEILGLTRTLVEQGEMFHGDVLLEVLPAPAGVEPGNNLVEIVNNPGSPPPSVNKTGSPPRSAGAYTRDVLEISNLGTRDLGGADEGTRLMGRSRARAEQRFTEQAQAVASKYRHDGYVMELLAIRRKLREELFAGKTPTARKFALLYTRSAAEARELLGTAVLADNPAAKLNVDLRTCGVRY